MWMSCNVGLELRLLRMAWKCISLHQEDVMISVSCGVSCADAAVMRDFGPGGYKIVPDCCVVMCVGDC